jgi:hypothetical protein
LRSDYDSRRKVKSSSKDEGQYSAKNPLNIMEFNTDQ